MSCRIAVVAIDAVEPRVVADFWCAVLGWRVVEEAHDGQHRCVGRVVAIH